MPLRFLRGSAVRFTLTVLALAFGVALVGAIELVTPSGRRRFVIRGLLAPSGVAKVRGGNLVVMDIAAAEWAFTRPGLVNRVDVVVDRNAEVERVADAITAALPAGLTVQRPA